MSKQINAKVMDKVGFAMLSEYNVAYQSVCAIKAKYKALIETAEKALADIKAQRGEMLAQGFSEAEVVAKYSTVEAEKKIAALEVERDEALKPHNDTIRACVGTITDDLFGSYAYAMEHGLGATIPKKGATITVGKKDYFVEKSFAANIKDIVKGWKMGHADDDKAVSKFADIIKGRIAGMQKDSKGGYLKLKGQRVLGEMFLLATIQYFLAKGVFVANEDNTLSIAQ